MTTRAGLLDALAGRDRYVADEEFTVGLEPGEEVAGREFEQVSFVGTSFERAVFRDCTFIDCRFEECNLSFTGWTDSTLSGVTISGSKLVGTNFSDAHVGLVAEAAFTVVRSRLTACSFQSRDCEGWVFADSSLVDCDFSGSKLGRASFAGCDLGGTRFSDCDLRGTSFVGAVNYCFDPRDNRVQGLRLEAAAAGGVLTAQGMDCEPA